MSKKKKTVVNFDELLEQAGDTPETLTTIKIEETLATEETIDYIKEEAKPAEVVKPKQVTFKDRTIAQKLKLPNRQIY